MATPCLNPVIKELLLKLQDKPEMMVEVIRAIQPCAETPELPAAGGQGFVMTKPKPEEDMTCTERYDHIIGNIGAMKQLIREGSPSEMYDIIRQRLTKLGLEGAE